MRSLIVIHQLGQGEQHIVDNGHLVAWNCSYAIEKAGGGGMSAMKSGEGLVCRFTGMLDLISLHDTVLDYHADMYSLLNRPRHSIHADEESRGLRRLGSSSFWRRWIVVIVLHHVLGV